MDGTGKPFEGWMALIPLVVLALLVTTMLGGPVALANDVGYWLSEAVAAAGSWLKQF